MKGLVGSHSSGISGNMMAKPFNSAIETSSGIRKSTWAWAKTNKYLVGMVAGGEKSNFRFSANASLNLNHDATSEGLA
jgi:hypothetical protein